MLAIKDRYNKKLSIQNIPQAYSLLFWRPSYSIGLQGGGGHNRDGDVARLEGRHKSRICFYHSK